MSAIVDKTNHYATTPLDEYGNTKGGPYWKNLTVARLQAFMALGLYMELKVQPNYKTY